MKEPSEIRLPDGRILTKHSDVECFEELSRNVAMRKWQEKSTGSRSVLRRVGYRWKCEQSGYPIPWEESGDGGIIYVEESPYGFMGFCDDYGLYGIYDPDSYESFVSEDWGWDELRDHFHEQMRLMRMAIFSSTCRANWSFGIMHEPVACTVFREQTAPIVATSNRLILCDYSHLVSGARREDIKLPEDDYYFCYEIRVKPGTYNVRVIFTSDPMNKYESCEVPESTIEEPDIFLEVLETDNPAKTWDRIMWDD